MIRYTGIYRWYNGLLQQQCIEDNIVVWVDIVISGNLVYQVNNL